MPEYIGRTAIRIHRMSATTQFGSILCSSSPIQTFATLFRQKILGLEPRPAVIVHPDHPVAHDLAKMARNILQSDGTEILTFAHNDLKLMTGLSDEDVEN